MTFHLLRVRTDPSICQQEYLRIVFEGAPHISRQTREGAVGTTRAGFNTRLLASLDVPLPPVGEQIRIVEKVDRLLSEGSQVAQTIGATLARCRRLRQAVLRWAFEGKLVDQDPNDEPASVLLERIRAERGTQDQPRPRRGARRSAQTVTRGRK